MLRDRLIEMLQNIEIITMIPVGTNILQSASGNISKKSCEDIADFVQAEMKEQRQRIYKSKHKKGGTGDKRIKE